MHTAPQAPSGSPLIPLWLAAVLAAAAVTGRMWVSHPAGGSVSAGSLMIILAALVPVAVLLGVFYVADDLEPEPWSNLARYFLIGVASIGIVGVVKWLVLDGFAAAIKAQPHLLLRVAVSEELAKYLCFRLATLRDAELDEPYDGCVYGASVGLGFAALENVCFVFKPDDLLGSLGLAALRAATAVPAHALFGAAWGLAYGFSKFSPRCRRLPLAVVPAVIGLHAAYNWITVRAGQVGANLAGYFILVALLLLLGAGCVAAIHEAHRRSPHRRPGAE